MRSDLGDLEPGEEEITELRILLGRRRDLVIDHNRTITRLGEALLSLSPALGRVLDLNRRGPSPHGGTQEDRAVSFWALALLRVDLWNQVSITPPNRSKSTLGSQHSPGPTPMSVPSPDRLPSGVIVTPT